jgi:NHL repeat
LKTRSFLTLLGILIVVGIAIGALGRNPGLTEHEARVGDDLAALKASPDRERIWQDVRWQRAFALDSRQKLYGAFDLAAGPGGQLYVADFGDQSVKEFDASGTLVRQYGEGRGQGPGELASITDIAIGPGGELWVADHSNARITVFGRDGRVRSTLRPAVRPYRLAVYPDGGYALMQPLGSKNLFGILDSRSALRASFGRFLADQESYPLLLDGWIRVTPDGRLVYAGHFDSLLAVYGRGGDRRFVTRVIDPKPMPKLVSDSDGRAWVDRDAAPSTWSFSVSGDEIHLLSAERDGVEVASALDTYSLRDGSYLYSRHLPEDCDEMAVVGSDLYTATSTTVTRWTRNPG